jgi:hypothetical protein
LTAASATLALNTGVWFRRCRLLIVSPVRGHHRRFQAETPLIVLCRFANPALSSMVSGRVVAYGGSRPYLFQDRCTYFHAVTYRMQR